MFPGVLHTHTYICQRGQLALEGNYSLALKEHPFPYNRRNLLASLAGKLLKIISGDEQCGFFFFSVPFSMCTVGSVYRKCSSKRHICVDKAHQHKNNYQCSFSVKFTNSFQYNHMKRCCVFSADP